MKISEKIVRLTLEKFIDALQVCADRKYSKNGVIRFFGKKRAVNWCGNRIGAGYPEIPIILWYEKRYKIKFEFPFGGEKYFNDLRYMGKNRY